MTEPISLPKSQLGGTDNPYKINHTYFKLHPVCYHIHGTIDLIKRQLDTHDITPDDISSIHVDIYEAAINVTATPEKFDPDTRETADHSLPYCLARTITDGTMTLDQYTMDKITDSSLRPLMNRITVEEDPEFTEMYGDTFPVRLTIELTDQTIEDTLTHPKGHYKNPATPTELTTKFHTATMDTYPESTRNHIIDIANSLETHPTLTELFNTINIPLLTANQ